MANFSLNTWLWPQSASDFSQVRRLARKRSTYLGMLFHNKRISHRDGRVSAGLHALINSILAALYQCSASLVDDWISFKFFDLRR